MKKGAAFQWEVLVVVIIIVIFGYLFASNLLSEKGQVKTAARSVSDAVQKVPGVGDDEINRIEVPQPPKEVADAVTKLIQTLNIDTNKAPCIADYSVGDNKGLPDLNGYTLEFLPRTEPGPKYIVQLRSPDGRIVREFTDYVNPQLCVVGGEIYGTDLILFGGQVQEHGTLPPIADMKGKEVRVSTEQIKNLQPPTTSFEMAKKMFSYDEGDLRIAAQHFYNNWIFDVEGDKTLQGFRDARVRFISPDYTNPQYIEIKDEESMVMRYLNSGANIPLGKEDGGLLYVPASGHVCFFATKTGSASGPFASDCDAGGGFLDNDCLTDQRETKWIEKIRCK